MGCASVSCRRLKISKSIVALIMMVKPNFVSEDYGVAPSTIHKWIKLLFQKLTDNGEILTAKQGLVNSRNKGLFYRKERTS